MKINTFAEEAMKRMYNAGIPQSTIADYFQVTSPTVNYHVNGVTKAWKQGRYLKKILSKVNDGNAVAVAARYLA